MLCTLKMCFQLLLGMVIKTLGDIFKKKCVLDT